VKTMYRLDPELMELKKQILATPDNQQEQKLALETKCQEREQLLRPMYHQIAVHFADLHDTPDRMHEKGVIQDIIKWKRARHTLYWRLRRLLLQDRMESQILSAKPGCNHGQVVAMLHRWFMEDKDAIDAYLWENNQAVVEWLSQQLGSSKSIVNENIKSLRRDAVLNQANLLMEEHPELAIDSVVHLLQHMNPAQRADAIRAISKIDGASLQDSKPGLDGGDA